MNIIEIIKKSAVEAIEASKPTAPIEGTVMSASPLKIRINQMQILDSAFLILCEAVKSRTIELPIQATTSEYKHKHKIGETDTTEDTHTHTVSVKKTLTVREGLQKGDKVLLIRAPGGQKYYVVGRL